MSKPDQRRLTEILDDLFHNLTRLLQREIGLLKAEAAERSSAALRALLLVLAGALLALAALLCLMGAAAALLVEEGFEVWSAAALVGAGTGLVSAILLYAGTNRLRVSNLLLRRVRSGNRQSSTFKE